MPPRTQGQDKPVKIDMMDSSPDTETPPAGALPDRQGADVPTPVAGDLLAFASALDEGGIAAALRFLNQRTAHRYTGVFRFDGEMLRSVALVDRWQPEVDRGDDVPLAEAFCAHLESTGQPLAVTDGRADPRTPWMANSNVASYCGAVIQDADGSRWGALCHFDHSPCESKDSDVPLLAAAAALIHKSADKLD